MELLSKILIVVVIILVVLYFIKDGKYSCVCSTRSCPTQSCPPLVSRQEVLNIFNMFPKQQVMNTLIGNINRSELENTLNSSNLILPQDVPSLTPTQVKNLTQAQKFLIFIGYVSLFSKVNFTIDQLSALTPEEIKGTAISPFMIYYTYFIPIGLLNEYKGMTQGQIIEMSKIIENVVS